jgi:hypothetical protein
VIASDKYWVRTASPKFRFGPIAPRLSATPTAEEAAFAEENPRHHLFHYTDVPIQQSLYRAGTAGTRTDDVVQVITHAVNVLRGRAPNHGPAVLNERNALWLLAHLIGDVHQPLHVGTIYFDRDCEKPVDPNVAGAGQPNFGIGTAVVSSRGGNELRIGNGKTCIPIGTAEQY